MPPIPKKVKQPQRINTELLFESELSDIPVSKNKRSPAVEKDVNEIKKQVGADFEPTNVIDAFERANGILPPKAKKTNIQYDNILLNLNNEEDQNRFNAILNKKEYSIIMMEKFWSQDGNFNVWLVYGKHLSDDEEKSRRSESLPS